MQEDTKEKIKKLQTIYDQFLLDMAMLRKERAEIFSEFSQELDKVKVSKIQNNLGSTL